jgi:hypothetical protein
LAAGRKKKEKMKGGEGKARGTLNPIGQYARTGLGVSIKATILGVNRKIMITEC